MGQPVKLEGTVRQLLQAYGFLQYNDPVSENAKRLFWHFSEVVDQLELGIGDRVSFILTKGPKLKEEYARKIKRLAAVPAPSPADISKVAQKVMSAPLAAVRTPAMPDGTRGFHMGRGGLLPRPLMDPSAAPPGISTHITLPFN